MMNKVEEVINLKKIIKHIDKPLFFTSMLLFIIGLIMIFSSSNITAFMKYGASPYNYLIKQSIFLIISFILATFMIKFNTKFYGIISWVLVIGITIMLGVLLVVGELKNQAISWYDFGFFSFQPSEFAKVIMIVWMARYYEANKKNLDKYGSSLFPLLVGGIIAFLIIFQPDLGTAIIFSLIVFCIFLAVPISKEIKTKIFVTFFGLVIVVLLFLVGSGKTIIYERQLERLNFTRPCDRLLDTGNQVCNGYIAINNGGLFGVGLGNSTQKYLYLPEAHTDFIYAIIIEELGLIFGIGILLLYIFLLYRILKIGKESYTDRGATMCYGIALYIFLHIAVNLMGLFGLMPMTGVPLPFMSYGGSFTLCLIASLAIVQRVSVENGLRKEKQENRK